ncbi:MAG: MarR family transcriptional regulator [Gemmatimonadota bacterium]
MSTRLRSEIKQSRPFASPAEEAFLNLLRTAAALEHALEEGLKEHGVTGTQYNVLRILRGAGPAGLCRNEVKERMITPVPDATRLLDRLEQAGLVERRRETDDRRFVTARITGRGLDLLDRLELPISRLHERHLGHLSVAELQHLSELLERAREATA